MICVSVNPESEHVNLFYLVAGSFAKENLLNVPDNAIASKKSRAPRRWANVPDN